MNKKVWEDFKVLRDEPGHLESKFIKLKIPVVNIHGEHDPHGFESIRSFLNKSLTNIKHYHLPNCGHYPWIERAAKDDFYQILNSEIE